MKLTRKDVLRSMFARWRPEQGTLERPERMFQEAEAILNRTIRKVLERGWWFNTEVIRDLRPDAYGRVDAVKIPGCVLMAYGADNKPVTVKVNSVCFDESTLPPFTSPSCLCSSFVYKFSYLITLTPATLLGWPSDHPWYFRVYQNPVDADNLGAPTLVTVNVSPSSTVADFIALVEAQLPGFSVIIDQNKLVLSRANGVFALLDADGTTFPSASRNWGVWDYEAFYSYTDEDSEPGSDFGEVLLPSACYPLPPTGVTVSVSYYQRWSGATPTYHALELSAPGGLPAETFVSAVTVTFPVGQFGTPVTYSFGSDGVPLGAVIALPLDLLPTLPVAPNSGQGTVSVTLTDLLDLRNAQVITGTAISEQLVA